MEELDLNELYLKLSTQIEQAYNDVRNEIAIFNFDENETAFIDDIALSFTTSKADELALAFADFNNGNINFCLYTAFNRSFKYTAIHEFAHHIAKHYLSVSGHTLEFAIINYCLESKVFGKSGDYFRSYDIHEDTAYQFISLNPSSFDSLINNIYFSTLKELSQKASTLARKIREKAIPYGLAKLQEIEE